MSSASKSALALRIAVALVAGVVAGLLLGERAAPLGDIALLVIQMLKALAAPLVFLAVMEACSRIRIELRQGGRLLFLSLVNATVAGTIAISLDLLIPIQSDASNALRKALLAGKAPDEKPMELSFSGIMSGLLPKSVAGPFVNNEVIGAVFLALLFGLSLRKAKESAEGEQVSQLAAVDALVSGAFRLMMTGIGWMIQIVPVAVFGVVAKVVGQTGFGSLKLLGFFLAVVTLGFVLHGVVYYSTLLRFTTLVSPRVFYRQASEALMTAMGTGSSLATLPVTLRTLQEKMRVRPANARLAAMVGTNLNHDGILLYEAAAALFLARVLDVPLGPGDKVQLVAVSALAAFGIGGIPDAGLITLSLVLSTVHLPLAAVPLLLPLDWLIGRMRATLNVTSDLVVANVLESWDRPEVEPATPTEAP